MGLLQRETRLAGASKSKESGAEGEYNTYNMRVSLFLRSRKMPTWTAKTMMATTRAPRKALRLIPWKPWALPALPSGSSDVVLSGVLVAVVDDRMLDAAELAVDVMSEEALVDELEESVVDDIVAASPGRVVGVGEVQ